MLGSTSHPLDGLLSFLPGLGRWRVHQPDHLLTSVGNQIGDEEVWWAGSCARVDGIERHIWGTKRSVFVFMEFEWIWFILENVNPKLETTCDARTSCVQICTDYTVRYIRCIHASCASHAKDSTLPTKYQMSTVCVKCSKLSPNMGQ